MTAIGRCRKRSERCLHVATDSVMICHAPGTPNLASMGKPATSLSCIRPRPSVLVRGQRDSGIPPFTGVPPFFVLSACSTTWTGRLRLPVRTLETARPQLFGGTHNSRLRTKNGRGERSEPASLPSRRQSDDHYRYLGVLHHVCHPMTKEWAIRE